MTPVYVNVTALLQDASAWQDIRLIDLQLLRLARLQSLPSTTFESVPSSVRFSSTSAPALPPPALELNRIAEQQAESLAGQLSRGIEEKVQLRRSELAARELKIADAQRRQAQQELRTKREQISREYRLPLQNARLAVDLFHYHLKQNSEMDTPTVEAGHRREEELKRLEGELTARLNAVREEEEASVRQAITKVRADHQRALAEYRDQLEQEAHRAAVQESESATKALNELAEQMRASFSSPPPAEPTLDFSALAARLQGVRSPTAAIQWNEHIAQLQRQRKSALYSLRSQIQAIVSSAGQQRGLKVMFRRVPGTQIKDYTRQARRWLTQGETGPSDREAVP